MFEDGPETAHDLAAERSWERRRDRLVHAPERRLELHVAGHRGCSWEAVAGATEVLYGYVVHSSESQRAPSFRVPDDPRLARLNPSLIRIIERWVSARRGGSWAEAVEAMDGALATAIHHPGHPQDFED